MSPEDVERKQVALREILRRNAGASVSFSSIAQAFTERPVTATARKREVADELLRIEQLANWALEDGDPDVLAVCESAFAGDVAAWREALAWWPAWADSHEVAS